MNYMLLRLISLTSGFIVSSLLCISPAYAFQTQNQVENVQITVHVGASPLPTPAMGAAGSSLPIAVNLQAMPATYNMSVSTRHVDFNVLAGSTTTLSCAINVTHRGQVATIKTILWRDFLDLFDGNSFPGTSLSYGPVQGNMINLTYSSNGNSLTILRTTAGTSCINLQLTVPAGTPNGTYEDEMIYVNYGGSTAWPSPSPTPSPIPSATPSVIYAAPLAGAQYKVYAFNSSANGDVAPLYEFDNSYPTFSNPTDLITAPNGNLIVSAEGSNNVVIFPANSNGTTAPIATITNSLFSCPQSVGVDNAENVYVLQGCDSFWAQAAVMKFGPSSNGNVAALTEIPTNAAATDGSLVNPRDIAIAHDGTIYVANYWDGPPYSGDIAIFNTNASGSASPNASLQGSFTNIGCPGGIALDGLGKIYVLTKDDCQNTWPAFNSVGVAPPVNIRIEVYAANATGNVAPIDTIAGSATMLNNPIKMRVDASGGIYVADLGVGGILYFAPGSSGNTAPARVIYGNNTGLGVNNIEFASP